jgi:hypothetical protein
MQIGTTFFYNDLVALIMNIAGVVDVVISTPTTNHTATANQIIIPGSVAVTTT